MPRYFQCECIDKLTGRSFRLRLIGADPEKARSVASAWGFVTATPEPITPDPKKLLRGTTQPRQGKSVTMCEVWAASYSNDFDERLRVRNQDCPLADRHYLLQSLAEEAYKLREGRSDALTWCEWACWQWLMEAPLLIEAVRREFPPPGEFVSINVPKRLVILLEKARDTERAAEVARGCQQIGLKAEDAEYLARKVEKFEKAMAKK